MSAGLPELSRVVPLARLGAEPFRQEIVATEAERAALARRFDLISLDRLNASVELSRRAHDLILLIAVFDAEFQQSCVVTLDPVPGAASERFSLLYGRPEAEEGAISAEAEDEDDVAFEPLTGDAIDIGEAVAQEFSLALPPFPRCPDAAMEAEAPASTNDSPFASLSRPSEKGGSE
jgi:uncharacterized metal-binding protein YceD (DUF177 family)